MAASALREVAVELHGVGSNAADFVRVTEVAYVRPIQGERDGGGPTIRTQSRGDNEEGAMSAVRSGLEHDVPT